MKRQARTPGSGSANPDKLPPTHTDVHKIPEGWAVRRLDEVADLLSGGTPSKARPEWWRGPIPWASPKDMKQLRLRDTQDHISEEALRHGSRLAPPGTIFVVIRGMILAKELPVAMAEVPMAFNQDMKAILPDRTVDADYLLYAIASRKGSLARDIGTSAHGTRRMGTSSLEGLLVPIPSLEEQRAIATVLSKIQGAFKVQTKIVARLKELKAATMAKLFREGLRGEPLKQTEIGEIPESWSVARLGDHVLITSGGTPARDTPEYWNGRVPWVKTGEINYRPIMETEEYITEAGLQNSSAKLLPPGTLLLAMYGQGVTRGKVALLGIQAATNQACAALFPSDRLDSGYLYAFFAFAYERVRSLGHGANQKNLSADIIREIRLPLPPDVGEQKRIYDVTSALEAYSRAVERKRDALATLFSSMLHLLMTGQVRVPLDLIGRLGAPPGAGQGSSARGGQSRAAGQHGKPDEAMLQEIVRRIVAAVAPEEIILFGSAARGEMGPDSDIDLLVVKACEHRREVARAVRDCLRGVAPGRGKDVVVVTPEDVERDRYTIGYIIRPALRGGRVLYAA